MNTKDSTKIAAALLKAAEVLSAGVPLQKEDYDALDVEIRELIVKINRLPFVVKTVYACAGYGASGENPEFREEADLKSEGGHAPHMGLYKGYVMIAYVEDRKLWKSFHEAMKKLSNDYSRSEYWEKVYPEVFSYDIAASSPTSMEKKWKQVERLVDARLAGRGSATDS